MLNRATITLHHRILPDQILIYILFSSNQILLLTMLYLWYNIVLKIVNFHILLSFYYHKRLSGHSPGNRFSILFVILFRPYIYFQAKEKPVEPKFYGYLTFEHNVILR